MKKQAGAFLLAIIIFIGATTPVANARSISGSLDLTFNGTTATCTFTTIATDSDIEVTMTLWQGSKQIQSWSVTGSSMVRMNEQCMVTKGQTYTLKVNVTVDGKAMPEQSVTKSN